MVHKPLANGLRTKCAYVWMGLRTCAAPSANGLHTIRCVPKFMGFLRYSDGTSSSSRRCSSVIHVHQNEPVH